MNKNVSFRIIGKLIKFMPAFACACLCLFATAAFAQDNTLTVRLDKVPLTQAISKIEGESRYLFMLGDGIDAARQIVSVDAESQPINQVLDQLVRGTGLTYSVEGQNILLSVKKDDSRPVRISGKVLDGNGFPVIGAAVLVKGTTIGVSTDLNGDYTLQVPPPLKCSPDSQLFGLSDGRGCRGKPYAGGLHAPRRDAAGRCGRRDGPRHQALGEGPVV